MKPANHNYICFIFNDSVMLFLGIDLGTSSVKVSVIDGHSGKTISSVQYPETESPVISVKPGWAEQDPDQWWSDVQSAIHISHATQLYNPLDIKAIGIAYQMHGLVLVDKEQKVLRNSIIWCDSRAVEIGNRAFEAIGKETCLSHLLNSPGNFTASKLAWVKTFEPEIYESIDKVLLPGDFIAMRLTGAITTTASALSEGIFWDFKTASLSKEVLNHFHFSTACFPEIKNVFQVHGIITPGVANKLMFADDVVISYKAGDQPNNALSLNVLQPGEVAATAGTSGVIYAVSDHLTYDHASRVNSFAHVNHTGENIRTGVLLCINGTGSVNRWARQTIAGQLSYQQINAEASGIAIGSEGLRVIPFGNGVERMLDNKLVGAHLLHINLNQHKPSHIFRATQEGIACAMRYGLDIMRENNIHPTIIRAGHANMFLSTVFAQSFVNLTQVPVELYHADGSVGAAIGAAIGVQFYKNFSEAFIHQRAISIIEPDEVHASEALYQSWKKDLQQIMLNNR